MTTPHVTGVVLAAGAGTRYGGPKARALDAAGVPWLHRVAAALTAGGCQEVVVVLGAAPDAVDLLPDGVRSVVAAEWEAGLSRSVRAGLAAADGADAAILAPVDVPELPAAAVARIRESARDARRALVRATYGGVPGHPVLIGAEWFAPVGAAVTGDSGAGPFLAAHGATSVACDDLWSGRDHDTR